MAGRRIHNVCVGFLAGALSLLPGMVFGQVPVSRAAPQPFPGQTGSAFVHEQPGPDIIPDDSVQEQPGHVHGIVRRMWGYVDPENAEIISVHQLACLVDHLDKSLQCRGKVVVKGPDVWGQNRLTAFRGEYEDQMRSQLGTFEIILSGYQRRADLAALTSATSVGASVGPQISKSRNVTSTTNVSPASAPVIPSAAGLVGPNGLVANANSLIGTMTPPLMPSNLTTLALANKGAAQGLGIEPTVLLDERSRFLNHLHELRRINMGDDRTDMPGYSLYLVRMPVSILPGDESVKGKGALVTVQAKHNLTPDVLANTFSNVVILDTQYQLMDIIIRGQYLHIRDEICAYDPKDPTPVLTTKYPTPQPTSVYPLPPPNPRTNDSGVRPSAFAIPEPEPSVRGRAGANLAARPGSLAGTHGAALGSPPASELVALYGEQNLRILVCSFRGDEQMWFRHDPSVVNWLLTELSAAYGYIREQARLGNPCFQPEVFESMGNLAIMRDYGALAVHRDRWLREVAKRGRAEVRDPGHRHEDGDVAASYVIQPAPPPQVASEPVRPVDILAFALMVQSVFVDRMIKYDMHVMMQRKGCAFGDPYQYGFYNPWPDAAATHAFNAYVECKWPIHVYSLDPVVDQQNQLDLFSERTELQLALATAIATGQASFENATTYARRIEQDLATVNLNRTAIGFGAGETTFGWRFRPRIQTPPTQSNPRRILGILANNGPGPEFALKNLQIEPGLRECYALMVVPNFVPALKLTTITNWYDLKTCHPDQALETTDMMHLGRKLQVARDAMQRLCDSGRYRPVDLELLHDRLDQLEAMLPMQSHQVMLPFEADLTGSEIFSSANAGLAPRLLTWSGAPGEPGGSVFIMGTGFNIHDLKVIVGGVALKDPSALPKPDDPPTIPGSPPAPTFELISRNVLRIDIPKNAKPIRTPVVFQDPSIRDFDPRLCYDCNKAPYPLHPAEEDRHRTARAPAAGPRGAHEHDAEKKPASPLDCEWKQRWVIDVHVATSNGVSNHLFIDVPDGCASAKEDPKHVSTTVTTITKPNPADGSTTTSTQFQTTPPGVVLPPGTYLPMGGNLPPGATLVAPGAATINGNSPAYLPGTVPSTWYPPIPPPKADGANNQGALDLTPADPVASSPDSTEAPGMSPSFETGQRMAALLPAMGARVVSPPTGDAPAELATWPVGAGNPRGANPFPPPSAASGKAGIPSSSPVTIDQDIDPAGRQSAQWPGRVPRSRPGVASTSSRVDPGVLPASATVSRGGTRTAFSRNSSSEPARSDHKPAGPTASRKSLLSRMLGRDR
jgi:hypothetical protein